MASGHLSRNTHPCSLRKFLDNTTSSGNLSFHAFFRIRYCSYRRGLKRYIYRDCGKAFNDKTGTIVHYSRLDYNVLMGHVILIVFSVATFVLIVDLLLPFVDPRVGD